MTGSGVPPGPVVTRLFAYPIKGCRGVSLERLPLDDVGPVGDRRWMVVSAADGEAVTQRTAPDLVRVTPLFVTGGPAAREPGPWAAAGDRPAGDDPAGAESGAVGPGGLRVEAPDAADLLVWEPGPDAPLRPVRLWGDRVDALDAGDEAADWFSERVGQPVRLVRLPDAHRRPVSADFAVDGFPSRVAFADGYPLLVVSEESVEELNRRLGEAGSGAVGVERFRPNVVVRAGAPHAEDDWRRIRVGGVAMELVKPCARCVVVTVDPDTARSGAEPLRTLSTYRRSSRGVLMGQNALHGGPGVLRVGGRILVEEGRTRNNAVEPPVP